MKESGKSPIAIRIMERPCSGDELTSLPSLVFPGKDDFSEVDLPIAPVHIEGWLQSTWGNPGGAVIPASSGLQPFSSPATSPCEMVN
jgi:hypothetical protein